MVLYLVIEGKLNLKCFYNCKHTYKCVIRQETLQWSTQIFSRFQQFYLRLTLYCIIPFHSYSRFRASPGLIPYTYGQFCFLTASFSSSHSVKAPTRDRRPWTGSCPYPAEARVFAGSRVFGLHIKCLCESQCQCSQARKTRYWVTWTAE